MTNHQPILLIGAGSIGERHIRNLWSLGYNNIIVYRQRNLPFRDIANAQVEISTNWNDALAKKPLAAIVCTPTAQHLQQTLDCINNGIHVLVEKPLAHENIDAVTIIDAIQKNKVLVQVAYMMRYHPLLQQVKNFAQSKQYGNLVNIQTFWGEYLPAWHPWEDYRTSYAAQKESGGGAALTLSHDIDVANWIAGADVNRFASFPNHHTALEVNTNAAFDLNIAYTNNVTAHVHVNYCQPIAQRWYKFIFDQAVMDVDFFKNSLCISTKESVEEVVLPSFDRNDLFIAQAKDFFQRIASGNFTQFSIDQIQQSASIIQMCTNE
jgi:predicted dehydrogenase